MTAAERFARHVVALVADETATVDQACTALATAGLTAAPDTVTEAAECQRTARGLAEGFIDPLLFCEGKAEELDARKHPDLYRNRLAWRFEDEHDAACRDLAQPWHAEVAA